MMSLPEVLRRFLDSQEGKGTLAAVKMQEARPATYGDWPEQLSPEVTRMVQSRGVERLYSHQSQAINHVLSQKHTVIVTPTASGKTLCYNLPVLEAIQREDTARALYMFPTKALEQDQLGELQESIDALKSPARVFTYDGDTPADARRAIRGKAHVVITNPDMLHTGILPHHTRWSRFFANLKYVVMDEVHTYRGVYGSHLANVLRRLKRIANFHGSNPTFVMCSATIANPKEHAEALIEQAVELVDQNGAPAGARTLVFYNPPVLNKELGIRRSYLTASRWIATRFLKADLQTIVFAGSRLNAEVLSRYLKDRFERTVEQEGRIRAYRGGYLPGARREIEKGLRDGSIRGVVSTNALELGIDIGSLQAAILAGYPGTVASTWQQAGRAGRRHEAAAVVLVARSDPLDQFLMENPDYFFNASPEQALINADNVAIKVSHLKCAAFELPIDPGETFGRENTKEILDYLAENQVLHLSGGQYHWTQEAYPADAVSLRTASPENFCIMDVTQNNRVIAEVDWSSAPSTVYEDAIYMCQARTYQVKKLDYAQRRAYVKPVEVDYYTDAITATSVKILDGFEREDTPTDAREHGEVHVTWRVSGFKKIKFYSRENVGYGEVNLPDHEMHTTAFWLTLKHETLAKLGYPRSELLDGVVGLAYCLHHLAPFYLMCDLRDLDRCVGDRAATWFARSDRDTQGRYSFAPAEDKMESSESWMRTADDPFDRNATLEAMPVFEPTLFLYDNYPGGMGFSAQIYDRFAELAQRARERLEHCQCESGCPSCVGPPNEVGNASRLVALAILNTMMAPVEELVPA